MSFSVDRITIHSTEYLPNVFFSGQVDMEGAISSPGIERCVQIRLKLCGWRAAGWFLRHIGDAE